MNNPGKDSHKIISPLELKKTVNLALVIALERVRKDHLFFACPVRRYSLAQSAGWPSPPPKKKDMSLLNMYKRNPNLEIVCYS